jgi:hypothetical protein
MACGCRHGGNHGEDGAPGGEEAARSAGRSCGPVKAATAAAAIRTSAAALAPYKSPTNQAHYQNLENDRGQPRRQPRLEEALLWERYNPRHVSLISQTMGFAPRDGQSWMFRKSGRKKSGRKSMHSSEKSGSCSKRTKNCGGS